MRLRNRLLPVITIMLYACSGSQSSADRPTENLMVFTAAGKLQCEPESGISTAESGQILESEGILVLDSFCGIQTDLAFPAVCGGGTPDIILHSISSSDENIAVSLGYLAVSNLETSNDQGYQLSDCTE